jgi:hypothetical protein
MGWADSYTIADSATVNQSWVRTSIEKDVVRYVNDTARAAGTEEYFELRRSSTTKGAGAAAVKSGRWNFFFSTRVIATETVPSTFSTTVTFPESVSNVVATARTRFKNGKLVLVALSDTDAEVDLATAARVV